jgi:hypothetical protein
VAIASPSYSYVQSPQTQLPLTISNVLGLVDLETAMSACWLSEQEVHLLKLGGCTVIRTLVRDGLTANQAVGIYASKRQLYLGVHRMNSFNLLEPRYWP